MEGVSSCERSLTGIFLEDLNSFSQLEAKSVRSFAIKIVDS